MGGFGIVYDPVFLKHDPGSTHPESAYRLKVILDEIENNEELKSLVKFYPPDTATQEEVLWNHSKELYEEVEKTQGKPYTRFDPDTTANEYTFEAALKAVGAQKTGLKLLLEEEFDGVFCLVRPPGHHAEYDRAMGFCFFNNVAIAAHYAMNFYGLDRILIVDWDLHHGNGTQSAFYDSDKVLYFSIHQYPYYPGTGHYTEVGRGDGAGFTINVPVSAYSGDEEYFYAFETVLKPIAYQFKPQLILVSAGYDCCKDDPLGDMEVSPDKGIAILTTVIKEIADEFCNGKVLFTLEGGYNSENLKKAFASTVFSFLRKFPFERIKVDEKRIERFKKEVIVPLKDFLSFRGYWEFY